MTGCIKKRSEGSYTIIVSLGKDPVTGKKKQSWRTIRGNKRDAERELTKLLNELNTGTYLEPSKLTVAEYLEKWLAEYAQGNVAGKTYERYCGIVRRQLIPDIGALPLAKLQPLHIQSHYTSKLQGGRLDGRAGGLSAQTIVHHHRVLKEALDRAVKWGLLVRNPALAAEPPKPQKREIQAIDEDASVWLIDAAMGTRLYVPVFLAITTGMRRGEVLALRWSDVDMNRGYLTAARAIEQTKLGGLKFKTPKNRKGRQLSLPPVMVDALRLHRVEQEKRQMLLGDAYEQNDLVCCVEDGSIWKPSAFTSAYEDLLRRRGIKKIRFHDLRHSHASQLLRSGVNPKIISERLGHSKVGFTLDVYAHLLPGMQEEAATLTNASLSAAFSRQTSRRAN